MKLIEKLIPSRVKRPITEVQSWTVSWRIGNDKYYKIFVEREHLNEYVQALYECASFLHVSIWVDVVDNSKL
jgi:hypothetical protein